MLLFDYSMAMRATQHGTSRAIMASAFDMCSVAATAAALDRSIGAAPEPAYTHFQLLPIICNTIMSEP